MVVIESAHELLLKLGICNTGANGDPATDSLLNTLADDSKLLRRVLRLAGHARCCRVQGGDLEQSVGLHAMLGLHDGLQVHLRDRF